MAIFTKQEKYIIAFLIIGAICGVSYSYYKRFHLPIDIRFKNPLPEDDNQTEELDRLINEAKSVNLNTASLEELMKLNGVGPVLAERIIEYRTENGPFKNKEELKKVTGIGPKKFDAIKDFVLLE